MLVAKMLMKPKGETGILKNFVPIKSNLKNIYIQ